MSLNNLMKVWRTALLGAINGLFSSAVYLMVYRFDEYYAELQRSRWIAQAKADGLCTLTIGVNPFWWVPASCWHIILFIVSSLFIHRYLAKRFRSVFLLWQFIGLMVMVGWGITVLIGTILDGYLVKGEVPLEAILGGVIYYTLYESSVIKFLALMMAINVIYGTVMQVAARHYRFAEVE